MRGGSGCRSVWPQPQSLATPPVTEPSKAIALERGLDAGAAADDPVSLALGLGCAQDTVERRPRWLKVAAHSAPPQFEQTGGS
jgi:hypothetical protein